MARASGSAALPRPIPDIDLRVSATMHHVDFAREDVDLAIRHGDGNWPGLMSCASAPSSFFRFAVPKLVSGRNRITKAADLLKFPLLRLDDWEDLVAMV